MPAARATSIAVTGPLSTDMRPSQKRYSPPLLARQGWSSSAIAFGIVATQGRSLAVLRWLSVSETSAAPGVSAQTCR